jgi:hypothetical protein
MTVSPPEGDWEHAATIITQRNADRYAAAWVLTRAPFWRYAKRGGVTGPVILGVVLFVLVVAMVVLAPSAESHFIYTDF